MLDTVLKKFPQENLLGSPSFWLNLWQKTSRDHYVAWIEKKLDKQFRVVLSPHQFNYLFEDKKINLLVFQEIYSTVEHRYKHKPHYQQLLNSLKEIEHNISRYSEEALFEINNLALAPLVISTFKKICPERVWSWIEPGSAREATHWEGYYLKLNESPFAEKFELIKKLQSIYQMMLTLLRVGFLHQLFHSFLKKFPDKVFFYQQVLSAYDTVNLCSSASILPPEYFYAQKNNQLIMSDFTRLRMSATKPANIFWLQAKMGIYHHSDINLMKSLCLVADCFGLTPLDWAKKLDHHEFLHRVWKNMHMQFFSKAGHSKNHPKLQAIIHASASMNALQWLILCQRPIHFLKQFFHLSEIPLSAIKKKDSKLNTALHYAACNKICDWLGYLIKNIPATELATCLEAQNSDGYTPLLVAASKGHLVNVELLMRHWARVRKKVAPGPTLIDLMNYSFACTHRDTYTTPLHIGAQFLSTNDFAALLKKWPQCLNQRNTDGNTVLHLAVMQNKVPIIELVLSQHPEMDIKNLLGLTAIDYAREQSSLRCFGLIAPNILPKAIVQLQALGFNLEKDDIYKALKYAIAPTTRFSKIGYVYQSFLNHVKEYSKPEHVYQFLQTIQTWVHSVDMEFQCYLEQDPFFNALQKLKHQLDKLHEKNNINNNLTHFFNHHHKKKAVRQELLALEHAATAILLDNRPPGISVKNDPLELLQAFLLPTTAMTLSAKIPAKL